MAEMAGHGGHPAGAGTDAPGAATVTIHPSPGLRLLGEHRGSEFTGPRYLVRRGDGQVIQLSQLLYLVMAVIVAGGADGGCDASRVAARIGAAFGWDMTADNVRYLVADKLAPLGVAVAEIPGQSPAVPPGVPPSAPRMNLLLGLRIRGVLLRSRAAGAASAALAWLLARMTARGTAAARLATRLSPRVRVPAFRVGLTVLAVFLVTGLGLAWALTPSPSQRHSAAAAPARPQPRQQPGTARLGPAPASSARGRTPGPAARTPPGVVAPSWRPARSGPVTGATLPALAASGRYSTVTTGASSAAARSRAAPPAAPPPVTSAPPQRATPEPPGGSASQSGSPAPLPSCALGLGVPVLANLLCP